MGGNEAFFRLLHVFDSTLCKEGSFYDTSKILFMVIHSVCVWIQNNTWSPSIFFVLNQMFKLTSLYKCTKNKFLDQVDSWSCSLDYYGIIRGALFVSPLAWTDWLFGNILANDELVVIHYFFFFFFFCLGPNSILNKVRTVVSGPMCNDSNRAFI